MKNIKIFLASSNKMLDERKDFEIFLSRQNSIRAGKKAPFELVIWEKLSAALSPTRSQDEYNEALKDCDVFVVLFHTRVGQYTEEEFNAALKCFQETGKPKIYTYLKTAKTDEPIEDSVEAFKKRLSDLGHFYATYENTDSLISQFRNELEKMEVEGFFSDSIDELIKKIKTDIASGIATSKILGKYRDDIIAVSDVDMELTMLQARSTKLEKDSRIGVIGNSDKQVEQARINHALMSILDDIKSDQEY